MGQVFIDFVNALACRTILLTEDSVRYSFFACMLKQDPDLNHYTMERPYQSFEDVDMSPLSDGKKELDMFYAFEDSLTDVLCIEFKFHRKSDSTFAHTDAAGSIVNDIHRLQLIQSPNERMFRRLMVYVTDNEMHNYFSKETKNDKYRQHLKEFYELPQDQSRHFQFDSSIAPKTFMVSASHSFRNNSNPDFEVKKLFDERNQNTSCPTFSDNKMHIVIYEVLNT